VGSSCLKGIKMIKKTHSTRKPSKLETQLRMSIKLAKLEKRLNSLEAEVLRLGNRYQVKGVSTEGKSPMCSQSNGGLVK
jgi:hypothetical protein